MIDEVSYESRMLGQLAMPTRTQVGRALLRVLLKHGGVVKEFGAGQEIVDQLADEFQLNRAQRTATLETVYRKEDRVKKSLLGTAYYFVLLICLRQKTSSRGQLKQFG